MAHPEHILASPGLHSGRIPNDSNSTTVFPSSFFCTFDALSGHCCCVEYILNAFWIHDWVLHLCLHAGLNMGAFCLHSGCGLVTFPCFGDIGRMRSECKTNAARIRMQQRSAHDELQNTHNVSHAQCDMHDASRTTLCARCVAHNAWKRGSRTHCYKRTNIEKQSVS